MPEKKTHRLSELLKTCTCPACGHHVAVSFYDGGRQPLTTLAWPLSAAEAKTMKRLPLSFVRCVDCGHVFNREFNYDEVPYSDKPNLMFNKGRLWQEHLRETQALLMAHLPENPVVVEIGCGEGHFLRALAEANPNGRYIGFDPNGGIHTGSDCIEARTCLFEPERHLAEVKPDLIIIRHMLEHLVSPLAFLQSLSFAAAWHDLKPLLFIEVPCIDRVFETGRTCDFFYEHNSHFTRQSLTRLMERCGTRVEQVQCGYDEEVVYGLAQLGAKPEQSALAREALHFHDQAVANDNAVGKQMAELASSGKRVAIWGGTGKAAAFINRHHLDAEQFPIVVDSDPDKAETFVPGMGQEILPSRYLQIASVDIVVIATQWRARDIVMEMESLGIASQSVLLEYRGRLVDYHRDAHPYKTTVLSPGLTG